MDKLIPEEGQHLLGLVRYQKSGEEEGEEKGEEAFEEVFQACVLFSDAQWEDLCRIFREHYEIVFPFFHQPTFSGKINAIKRQEQHNKSSSLFILAFVALTLSFCKDAFHQRYADAAVKEYQLANPPDSIEIPQALLMLSLHEHSNNDKTSHILLENAIKTMQLLRHNTHDKTDEVEKRTFWSCFLMERLMRSWDFEPYTIGTAEYTSVELPCSNDRFLYEWKTMTRMLNEKDYDFNRRRKKELKDLESDVAEVENTPHPLSVLILAFEIYGNVWHATISPRFQLDFPEQDNRVKELVRLAKTVCDQQSIPYVLLHSTLLVCRMLLQHHLKGTPFLQTTNNFSGLSNLYKQHALRELLLVVDSEDFMEFDFDYGPSAAEFVVSTGSYLKARPDAPFRYISTSTLVMITETAFPRVLLIQRAANEPSNPNKWEPPGGACEDYDKSILHGAARELWEEAGLRATHVAGLVGDPYLYTLRDGKKVCQFNFAVHVKNGGETPLVRLDPKEHQNFVWATKDEVEAKKVNGIDLDFTTDEVRRTVLLVFKDVVSSRV